MPPITIAIISLWPSLKFLSNNDFTVSKQKHVNRLLTRSTFILFNSLFAYQVLLLCIFHKNFLKSLKFFEMLWHMQTTWAPAWRHSGTSITRWIPGVQGYYQTVKDLLKVCSLCIAISFLLQNQNIACLNSLLTFGFRACCWQASSKKEVDYIVMGRKGMSSIEVLAYASFFLPSQYKE